MHSFRMRAVVYSFIILLGLLSALPNLLPSSLSKKLPVWYAENTITPGLDLRGGSHLLMEVDTRQLIHNEKITQAELKRDAVERSLIVIRKRLNETGLVDPSITRQGDNGILIQLPGVDDPQMIRKLLGTTAKMTFHWVKDGKSIPGDGELYVSEFQNENVSSLNEETRYENKYRLERKIALEGKHVSDAELGYHHETGEPLVTFKLDKEGARIFARITQSNVGRALAVVLDKQVITAPVIREAILGGSGEISGHFTSAEANNLALLLRAGALPAPLNIIEERTVGPDLGSDSIKMGLNTGAAGILFVFAFMIALYGRWGIIACTGLAVFIGMVFGVLSLLSATLTLPGIAGFILSIGMAVDANILINERIREEIRNGKSAYKALNAGFNRAFSTILDSNVTSLIAISLLFMFGSGPVRGFAVTMAVGLMVSMFTAISVTRLIMEWRVKKMGRRPLQISPFKIFDRIHTKPINFMRGRFIGVTVSAVLSLASIFLFINPGLNYGIDFSGGTLVEVIAPETSVDKLRSTVEKNNLANVAIQEFGRDNNYLLRLPIEDPETVASGKQVEVLKETIRTASSDAIFNRVELVGPKVSSDFADATILAICLAGLGMLVYLWHRFESHFAIAATLTLALDLTKTIGFFVLAEVEFNLTAVAALLALIGYSVNDKVVVFDRIRENLRLTPDKPLVELLNESITSTLTRTVFTSLTTLLAILPMAMFGGSAVASFALPMLFGIVVGTSSSVYIATPILYWLGQRRISKGLVQLRPTQEELKRELDLIP